MEALIASSRSSRVTSSSTVNLVGLFDDEEIGSLLRQGARGNFLPITIERITQGFPDFGPPPPVGQTYANSFFLSADVTHGTSILDIKKGSGIRANALLLAVNPNFLNAYLANHGKWTQRQYLANVNPRTAPKLNVGISVSADPNGHMTTDAVSTAFLQQIAERTGCELQTFQIRNDSRSGGTIGMRIFLADSSFWLREVYDVGLWRTGPMLSSAMGVRAIDVGIPQLSMHSIRATTGSLDPGLGVKLFKGFFDHYEKTDEDFRDDR